MVLKSKHEPQGVDSGGGRDTGTRTKRPGIEGGADGAVTIGRAQKRRGQNASHESCRPTLGIFHTSSQRKIWWFAQLRKYFSAWVHFGSMRRGEIAFGAFQKYLLPAASALRSLAEVRKWRFQSMRELDTANTA